MLYLFWGANELARSEALQALKAMIPEDLRDFNLTQLDGRKLKSAGLAQACEAFPFLHERRLVIVEEAIKGLRSAKEREEVRAYLPRLPATTDLVFVEGDDFDKRSAIYTWIKKAGQVREFLPYQGAELIRWLVERAQRLGVKLAPDGSQLLVDWSGNEGRALATELDKLAAYVGSGGVITADTVRLLVADRSESSVFTFVDALAARKRGPALLLLHDLLDNGEAPTYLLFMIGRQMRLLLAVTELLQARVRPDDMAAQLAQKPFVVRKAVDQARQFPPALLLEIHDHLVEYDHWSKTGRIEPDTALELLVAEVCS
ncbi:MAG: DNA polymerase III subunit delta [Herpetosiphonaceae bacterium]|nr:DNA polymerase III subunit delta [Herpetosiphonaceae bacterium]